MRTFSLILLVIVVPVFLFLLFHEPAPRGALDNFSALNIEAAISAANGTMLVGVIYVVARSLLYFVVGALMNLARLRIKEVLIALGLLVVRGVTAWGIYLSLFSYSREIGFTRFLWNLQDLGFTTDATTVILVAGVSLLCIALVPDLLVGLIFGTQEQGLVEKRKEPPQSRLRDETRDDEARVVDDEAGQRMMQGQ
jgi:hypothetical protein